MAHRRGAERASAAAVTCLALLAIVMLPGRAAAYPGFWVANYPSNECQLPTPATLSRGHPVPASTSNT